MAKQSFTTGQVLTAAQVNSLQANDFNQTVSPKTASYVLVASDKGTRIEFNTSGSVTCTVNTGLFDAGDTVYIQNRGAGVVTITAGTATVNTSASLALNQWEGGVLYFISASASVWYEYASTANGDITGVTAGTGISGGGTSGDVTITNTMATAIDAKGDLIVGTADNSFSRLAVSDNGSTLVADSSATTGLRWQTPKSQNAVYNSSFQVWQRGTSIAFGNGSAGTGYGADRWQFIYTGASGTGSRQATGDTTNLPNIQYCARIQRNSGQTSTQNIILCQTLENADSTRFVGQTFTFSFYARRGSNYSGASNNLTVQVNYGTGTDQNILYNASTGVISTTATLTTTWQRFTYTGTFPTNTTQVGYYLFYAPTGTAGANDYFEVTGIQLETGSVATPYTQMSGTLAGEYAAASRYYYRQNFDGAAAYAYFGQGGGYSTTVARILQQLPITMRKQPTIDASALSTFRLQSFDEATSAQPTILTANTNFTNTSMAVMDVTVASGLTAKTLYLLRGENNTGAYIGWSAEL